jgi:hypothetical protein
MQAAFIVVEQRVGNTDTSAVKDGKALIERGLKNGLRMIERLAHSSILSTLAGEEEHHWLACTLLPPSDVTSITLQESVEFGQHVILVPANRRESAIKVMATPICSGAHVTQLDRFVGDQYLSNIRDLCG